MIGSPWKCVYILETPLGDVHFCMVSSLVINEEFFGVHLSLTSSLWRTALHVHVHSNHRIRNTQTMPPLF